jgi:hypothetical protein
MKHPNFFIEMFFFLLFAQRFILNSMNVVKVFQRQCSRDMLAGFICFTWSLLLWLTIFDQLRIERKKKTDSEDMILKLTFHFWALPTPNRHIRYTRYRTHNTTYRNLCPTRRFRQLIGRRISNPQKSVDEPPNRSRSPSREQWSTNTIII